MGSILQAAKSLGITQNVSLRVLDEVSGKVVQEHIGHNMATNSMLLGIAHYLVGDGVLRQGDGILLRYVPQYISLGTMGLFSQDEDENGLPAGVGAVEDLSFYNEEIEAARKKLEDLMKELEDLVCCCYLRKCGSECDCFDIDKCMNEEMKQKVKELETQIEEANTELDEWIRKAREAAEIVSYNDYMKQRPGFGADGYSMNQNNGRKYAGLGIAFTSFDVTKSYTNGEVVSNKGVLYQSNAEVSINADRGQSNPWISDRWEKLPDSNQPKVWELITPSFPREPISFRDIVPEAEAELPQTVDVVLSAMISTGALAQFRDPDKDYIFITEAGLWSKRYYVPEPSNSNGLLAAYRIAPPDEKNWAMRPDGVLDIVAINYLKDEYGIEAPTDSQIQDIKPEIAAKNRDILRRQILKVGRNQVVQVIWKIQIGSIDQFANMHDLRKQYYDIDTKP